MTSRTRCDPHDSRARVEDTTLPTSSPSHPSLPGRGKGVGASASELCYASAMRRVDPKLTRHARNLRNASTKAERMLWLRLRQYRPRFTRQLVVGPYIVDLACREARLVIELDGGQHAEATAD